MGRSVTKIAILAALIVMVATTGMVSPPIEDRSGSPVTSSVGNGVGFRLPPSMFDRGPVGCPSKTLSGDPEAGVLNVSAVGSGVWASQNQSEILNNSGINSTFDLPSAQLSSDQYVFMGIEEPLNATAVAAVGAGEAGVPYLGTFAVPWVYLPNGTEVYSLSGPYLTLGAKYTFAMLHENGDWWNFTYDGRAITGSAAWENGTYFLGAPSALGATCALGNPVAPSFFVALYGKGTSTPTIPTTLVLHAISIAPGNGRVPSYLPASANALPQLNETLGKVYIEGSVQNRSLPTGALLVGSQESLGYPGADAAVWGNYTYRALGNLTISPRDAAIVFRSSEEFTANVTDQSGGPLAGVNFTWQLRPASLGGLDATKGRSVNFTAGSVPGAGSLWVNATYNCTELSARSNLTVSPGGGPAILSFSVVPPAVVVGEDSNFTVVSGSWWRAVNFAYSGLPLPCHSSNTSRLTCQPMVSGTYLVTTWVNDSSGVSSNASTMLTVYPDLRLTSFSAVPNPLTEGGKVTFVALATGGVPRLTYNFSGLPTGCPPGVGPSNLSCNPANVTGVFDARVVVEDAAGHSVAGNVSLRIVPETPAPLVTGFAADPNPVEVNHATTFLVNLTGGSGPFNLSYSGLPSGCESHNLSSWQCAPSTPGVYTVIVRATDTLGRTAGEKLTLQVLPAPPTSRSSSPEPFPMWLLYAVVGVLAAAVVALVAWRWSRSRSPRSRPPP
jgi:hypothetical protein